jgi:putative ABC transport system permease protein
MSWWFVSFRLIKEKRLSSFLSILLLAFGVGLISLMLSVEKQIDETFKNNLKGIDLVVGAKGSPLQIILSSVYHIDAPTGNISAKDAKEIAKSPFVNSAIPLGFGDSYKGYKILGTTADYLDLYNREIIDGTVFKNAFDVVLGSNVAEQLGLKIGDTFFGNHGLAAESIEEHSDHGYKVVGILENSNSVLDNLILTSLNSVWNSHDREHAHSSSSGKSIVNSIKDIDDEKSITSLLIKYRGKMGAVQLPRMINSKSNLQAAAPAIELNRLISHLGVGISTLKYLAYLVVFISAISVFIALYAMLKDNLYELALIRSFGAPSLVLFRIVLQQGIILSIIGFAAGMTLNVLGGVILNNYTESNFKLNVIIDLMSIETLVLFLVTLLIGIISAFIPAITAFKLNVSKVLSNG